MIPKRMWAHQHDLHIHPGSIHRARNRVQGSYFISLLHKEARLEYEVAKVAGIQVVKSQREGNFREVNPKTRCNFSLSCLTAPKLSKSSRDCKKPNRKQQLGG